LKKSIFMLCLFALVIFTSYAQPYTLEVTVAALSDYSLVELDPPGGVYDEPTLVTLTALPGVTGAGLPEVFSSWSGDLTGYENPATLYVDGPKSVTAHYVHGDILQPTPLATPPPYRLDVTIYSSVSSSSVTLDPPGGLYAQPTTVTLTAVSGGDEFFSNWGGDLSGDDNPTTIYVDGEKTVFAYFLHGDALPPGSIWFEPEPLQLKVGETRDTAVLCNSGDQNLAAYGFTITFDNTIVRVNTSYYSDGVQKGADGFISAANATIPGKLTVAGFDAMGKEPGARLHILDIAWEGLADGTTPLVLDVDSLTDSDSVNIGIREGIDGKIIVTSCLPGDVNEDGIVNIIDALLCAQAYVGLDPPNFNPACADTNCDGIISIMDALLIAQYYVNIVSGFCL
jgi:hypothetical protein